MDEQVIITALHTLYERLETLRNMQAPDILLPGRQKQYEQILEDAYAALVLVEKEVDELSEQLDFEHQRIAKAVEHIHGYE